MKIKEIITENNQQATITKVQQDPTDSSKNQYSVRTQDGEEAVVSADPKDPTQVQYDNGKATIKLPDAPKTGETIDFSPSDDNTPLKINEFSDEPNLDKMSHAELKAHAESIGLGDIADSLSFNELLMLLKDDDFTMGGDPTDEFIKDVSMPDNTNKVDSVSEISRLSGL